MGKSGLNYFKINSALGKNLRDMREFGNANVKLNLLKEHSNTFLFH